ncbi:MAG: lysophospholipid acyltransferase family protein [Acidothermaceae bacterium]
MRPGQHRRWFSLLAILVKPFLYLLTRHEWRGLDNVPRDGGVIIVANHVTVIDPFTLAHTFYDGTRRIPRYLAKAELFKVPVVGSLLRKGGQIPVHRRSRNAANSLRDAETAVAAGELVIIYPEGTCTRDPDGWPMVSKTGVARLALACDAPVIPVAHWGAHRILAYHSKRPHLFPRKLIRANIGQPVDLSKYRGVEPTNDVLREVTDLLMTRVTQLLGELRDQAPPGTFYVPTATAPPRSEAETGVA